MSKKFLVIGLTGVVMLTGCQSISDQIGKQIAKTVVEQGSGGKVKIDDLDQGKVKIQTSDGTMELSGNGNNGGLKITDNSGKEVLNATGTGQDGKVTINGQNGQIAVYGNNGATRPTDSPADLPSLDGATNFSLVVIGSNITLGYDLLNNTDLKGTCQKQVDLLTAKGWTASKTNLSFESDTSMMKNYTNADQNLLLTCGVSEGKVSIALSKNKVTPNQ